MKLKDGKSEVFSLRGGGNKGAEEPVLVQDTADSLSSQCIVPETLKMIHVIKKRLVNEKIPRAMPPHHFCISGKSMEKISQQLWVLSIRTMVRMRSRTVIFLHLIN